MIGALRVKPCRPKYFFANSVVPEEMAHNQDLDCLLGLTIMPNLIRLS